MWFLPTWLKEDWYDVDLYKTKGEDIPCSTVEMKQAINGHFSISHANFAPDNNIMQEGITVRQWRNNYEDFCRSHNQSRSPYAGYAYDAMWVYAYATDKLLKENPSRLFELHSNYTIDRFIDIIQKTDFNGVSCNFNFIGSKRGYKIDETSTLFSWCYTSISCES